ncbi:MAG: hypothetical protein ACW99G_10290 [Candidatus Thorarchaeota archaeon]|jgi:hypothetical protein
MSWNIVSNDDGNFTLLNGSETLIRVHKQIKDDLIVQLMSKMEEISFPIEYTEGVKEIHFTYLKNKLEGDYSSDGRIRVSCANMQLPIIHEILIHEIGHHIDAEECSSDDSLLVAEWAEKSGSFVHVDIHKEPCEYFAIGFEKYHSPDHSSGNITPKSHPILWNIIDRISVKKGIR